VNLEYIKDLINNKEFELAETKLNEMLADSKDKSIVLFNLAILYECQSKHDKAITFYKKIIDDNNDNKLSVLSKIEMAKILRNTNNIEKALDVFLSVKDNSFGNIDSDISQCLHDIVISCQNLNRDSKFEETIRLYDKYNNFISEKDLFLKNVFLNEYELANKKTILKSKPRSLHVFVTNQCNLSCIMCEMHKKKRWKIADRYIEEICDLFPYLSLLTLQGGEITILPYFKDILSKAKNYKNMRVSIISNFQFSDDEILDLLVANNISLTVSVDSVHKEKYEQIRKGANFDLLLSNLQKLNEIRNKKQDIKNFDLHFNCVIMNNNYVELEEFVNFASEYKVREISLSPVKPFVGDVHKLSTILLPLEQQKIIFELAKKAERKAKDLGIKINNEILSLHNFSNNETKIDKENNIDYKQNTINVQQNNIKEESKNNPEDKKELKCHYPWYQMKIEYNDVEPDCKCKMLGDSLTETKTLLDIWNGDIMQKYRKVLLMRENENFVCNKECFLDVNTKEKYKPILSW